MNKKDLAVYGMAGALLVAGVLPLPVPVSVLCAVAGAIVLAEWRARRRQAAQRRTIRALRRDLDGLRALAKELDGLRAQVKHVKDNTVVTRQDWGPGYGYPPPHALD